MAKTQFLTFEVHLQDAALVAQLQGAPPGETSAQGGAVNAIIRAPETGAAIEFQTADVHPLPLIGPGQTVPTTPYIYSGWFTSTNNFPRNVATFVQKSGGWFRIPWLFGDTTRYYWRGVFIYDPPPTTCEGTGGDYAPMPVRRWMTGFFECEASSQGSENQISLERWMTRDAARTPDGLGFAMRGDSVRYYRSLTDYTGGGASTKNSSWERIYFRLRKVGGDAKLKFWQASGTLSSTAGASLSIETDGYLGVYNETGGAPSLLGKSLEALVVGKVYKLDILLNYGFIIPGSPPAYNDGSIRVLLNGVEQVKAAVGQVTGGLGLADCKQNGSWIGTSQAPGWLTELDISYWHNAAVPGSNNVDVWGPLNTMGAEPFTSVDIINGSRAVLVKPTGVAASNGTWAGDWTLALQRPVHDATEALSTESSGDLLALVTDSALSIKALPRSMGIASLCVHLHSHKGTTNGKLGYKIGADEAVLPTVVQGVVASGPWWNSVLYAPTGQVNPIDVTDTPIEVYHQKGADTTIARVYSLMATAEVIGCFGAEDYPPLLDPPPEDPIPFLGVHNAPYPRSPWASTASAPPAPVVIKTGTYEGNGTHVDLAFPAPVHWFFARRIETSGGVPKGLFWYSSMLASHLGGQVRPLSSLMIDALLDDTFTPTAPNPDTQVDDLDLATAVIEGGSPADIGDWTVTETLESITEDPTGGFSLVFSPTVPDSWIFGDDNIQYTVWAFVKVGDVWHGAGFIQMWKDRAMGDGTLPAFFTEQGYKNWWGDVRHLWGDMSDYVPAAGDQVAFMVSAGNARFQGDVTSVKERSNVVVVTLTEDQAGGLGGGTGAQEEQTIVRIAGSHPDSNASGGTYAYVAVMDPGARFVLNGAMAHRNAGLPSVDPLIDATFLPKAAFLREEEPGTSTQNGSAYKGPGNAIDAVTKLSGSQATGALTLGEGAITVDAGVSMLGTDLCMPFSLWRMDDGSGAAGAANVVRITNYTGDGTGARTIALSGVLLPAATGKRPLWAIVIPNTSAGVYYRDPTHNGNSSSLQDGSQSVTAITGGGPDELHVGATLNSNGVVYNVFVIVGSATAGNDGWSQGGEFWPVPPDSPGGTQWGPPPEEPTAPPDGGGDGGDGGGGGGDEPGTPGEGADDIDGDLATACLPYTMRVVNMALARIGISQGVTTAFATETTLEAEMARLHLATAIRQTLRDFPWPFATRYAVLTWIAGSVAARVNTDWTFAYRQPADCIFERRIVVSRTGAVDPTPPPFALSFDDTGGRILTNQANAVLEYTARPECSAGRGDPLFLEALAWKLAGMLAGPLTRVADVTKLCEVEYQNALAKAALVLRPGNPGIRPVLDPAGLDPSVVATAANLAVVNRALIRIGARTVANLDTEQSREANAVRVLFEDELKSTLRDHPWAFATKYDTDLTLVAGTIDAPVNDDWVFTYRLPTDCVFVRRIVPAVGRVFDPEPIPFRAGQDATGALLYTNLENTEKDLAIEYTARIPSAVACADALFRDAFAWRLAASLAPSLAQIDPATIEQLGRGPQTDPKERKATEAQLRAAAARFAWQMYSLTVAKAQLADVREQQQEKAGDAEWITGRN